MSDPLLSVKNLQVFFHLAQGTLKAIDGVSLDVKKGQIVGLVGESGGGKSMIGLSILRLVPEGGKIASGKIIFEGKNLLNLSEDEIRIIRGSYISMILQDPLTSLNPAFRIGPQMIDVLRLHKGYDKKEAELIAIEMLHNIGIPDPKKNIRKFPHQLSGGMRQRVVIAIAFSCSPKLIIADEPTTALDVTIQAQILQLLKNLSTEYQTSVLFITHDLGIVANLCDSVAVIYAGEIVETAQTSELFLNPKHPYTKALFQSILRHDKKQEHFYSIEGVMGSHIDWPDKCKFYPRCSEKLDGCEKTGSVEFVSYSPDHLVRCLKYE
ncbi:MAG: ABC transporter ATP-binding protein [Deltaproteobacteria bacterium]|nr:ABC transporter ATP-binding protein [Deltaproteobacteria bacterium]